MLFCAIYKIIKIVLSHPLFRRGRKCRRIANVPHFVDFFDCHWMFILQSNTVCIQYSCILKKLRIRNNTNTDHDVQQILKDIIYSPTRKSPRRLQEKFTKSVCISRLETSDSCLPFSIMPQVLKLIQLTDEESMDVMYSCTMVPYYTLLSIYEGTSIIRTN